MIKKECMKCDYEGTVEGDFCPECGGYLAKRTSSNTVCVDDEWRVKREQKWREESRRRMREAY